MAHVVDTIVCQIGADILLKVTRRKICFMMLNIIFFSLHLVPSLPCKKLVWKIEYYPFVLSVFHEKKFLLLKVGY